MLLEPLSNEMVSSVTGTFLIISTFLLFYFQWRLESSDHKEASRFALSSHNHHKPPLPIFNWPGDSCYCPVAWLHKKGVSSDIKKPAPLHFIPITTDPRAFRQGLDLGSFLALLFWLEGLISNRACPLVADTH